ncbi:hypothetical protein PHYBOEH_002439 [Phytophthora boehmeriae]|uniref:RxLR effector protein n=1 Tax=Phytophthora boehmeriae TaxID=109152 RepID=A0A8T1WSC3_9STRA|nr:hypothetical protein PHYBOEH_002439 [Phytophthora boehmeriae]
MDNEERGLVDLAKKLKLEVNLKIHAKALKAPAIQKDLSKFKEWYLKGKPPENVWQDLRLAPVMKQSYKYGGIGRMKQDPNFQLYLNYEEFYKIIKRMYGKKA